MNDNPAVVVLNKGVEPLNETHNRKGFDCGVPALNDFCKSLLGRNPVEIRRRLMSYRLMTMKPLLAISRLP